MSRAIKQTRRAVLIAVIAFVALIGLSSLAWAVPEPRKIDTENVTKFEEPAEAGAEGEHEGKVEEGEPRSRKGASQEGEAEEPGHEGKVEEGEQSESLSEEKAIREGEAEEQGHEGEEEHVPVWMFPGWQTVFALLGVGYYAFMLTFLPRVMAKEEGHH